MNVQFLALTSAWMLPPGAVLWTCLLLVKQALRCVDLPVALPNQSEFLWLE